MAAVGLLLPGALALFGLCYPGSNDAVSTRLQKVVTRVAFSVPGPAACSEIDGMIRELADRRAEFDEAVFDGALWATVYTRGETPRWRFSRNLAGQAYFGRDKRFVNYAEVVGPGVHLRAGGVFEATTAADVCCPKKFVLDVTDATLQVGPLALSLPIRGRGYQRLLYADGHVRVLQSAADSPGRWERAGLVAVQVPAKLVLPPGSTLPALGT